MTDVWETTSIYSVMKQNNLKYPLNVLNQIVDELHQPHLASLT